MMQMTIFLNFVGGPSLHEQYLGQKNDEQKEKKEEKG